MNLETVPFIQAKYWGTNVPLFPHGRFGISPTQIVIHWIDGTLETADTVFQGKSNPVRQVSSHFAVEDTTIHQYVKVGDIAWQAGNWSMNIKTIGIEHSAQPGRDATDATYDTSGQLIAQIWRQVPSIKPNRDSLIPHRSIIATECPGTIDIDRLYTTALQYYGNTTPTATLASYTVPIIDEATAPIGTVIQESIFTANTTAAVNERYEPRITRPDGSDTKFTTIPKGTTVVCDQVVLGDVAPGYTSRRWYRIKDTQKFIYQPLVTVTQTV